MFTILSDKYDKMQHAFHKSIRMQSLILGAEQAFAAPAAGNKSNENLYQTSYNAD